MHKEFFLLLTILLINCQGLNYNPDITYITIYDTDNGELIYNPSCHFTDKNNNITYIYSNPAQIINNNINLPIRIECTKAYYKQSHIVIDKNSNGLKVVNDSIVFKNYTYNPYYKLKNIDIFLTNNIFN